MKNIFGILLASLLFTSIAKAEPMTAILVAREACVGEDQSNTNVIKCNEKAIEQADAAIAAAIKNMKDHSLTGTNAHGIDVSVGQAILDKAQAAFIEYRTQSAAVAAIAESGTASDNALAASELKLSLTSQRLTVFDSAE